MSFPYENQSKQPSITSRRLGVKKAVFQCLFMGYLLWCNLKLRPGTGTLRHPHQLRHTKSRAYPAKAGDAKLPG